MPLAFKEFYWDLVKTLLTGLVWSLIGLFMGLGETFNPSRIHADNFWVAGMFFGFWTGIRLIYGTEGGLRIVRSVLLALPVIGLSALFVPRWLGNTNIPITWFNWFMTYGLWTFGLGCGAIIATTFSFVLSGVNYLRRWFTAET